MTALLPCPFCGKDAILIDEDGYKTDKSDWCSCNGINCMGLLEQVKVVNWQKRPTESTLRAENAKLREDITGYRRTVSRQHSDLARLRELLGEVWKHCLVYDRVHMNPAEFKIDERVAVYKEHNEIATRIQSELKE